jgi:CRP/FNR family transcriptional regulator
MNAISRPKFVAAGQTIMADHEPTEFFANIINGVIKLTKMLSDGRQQIVGLLFAPDFVGRAYSAESKYFAEAASDVELCTFPRYEFEKLMAAHPGLEHRMFEKTLDELDACREWMLLLGRKSAEEKVSSFLLMIAERTQNIGCAHSDEVNFVQFDLPLTRADIADYLGLTIETVSRQITRLKTRGIITMKGNREIAIPDVNLLRQVADQELF